MAVTDNNDNEKSSPTVEFLKALFAHTEQPIFLQTLANNPDDPDEGPNRRHLMSRDIEAIERFVAKHDRSRRGTFVCVSTMRELLPARDPRTTPPSGRPAHRPRAWRGHGRRGF